MAHSKTNNTSDPLNDPYNDGVRLSKTTDAGGNEYEIDVVFPTNQARAFTRVIQHVIESVESIPFLRIKYKTVMGTEESSIQLAAIMGYDVRYGELENKDES